MSPSPPHTAADSPWPSHAHGVLPRLQHSAAELWLTCRMQLLPLAVQGPSDRPAAGIRKPGPKLLDPRGLGLEEYFGIRANTDISQDLVWGMVRAIGKAACSPGLERAAMLACHWAAGRGTERPYRLSCVLQSSYVGCMHSPFQLPNCHQLACSHAARRAAGGGREEKRPGSGSGGWGADSSRCVAHPGSGQLRDVGSVTGEGGGRAGSGAVQLQLQHYGYGHRPWDMDTLAGRMGMQAAFQVGFGSAWTRQCLVKVQPNVSQPQTFCLSAIKLFTTFPCSVGSVRLQQAGLALSPHQGPSQDTPQTMGGLDQSHWDQ
ncbi:hypothetical protein HaLaN_27388 [Haematococcus lacustris]|uniref:Uncharacterized protein n=1 Tax=Haematococcus lacustris TaxID=44745 RepID=A0A6A0A8A1_HAELA|nr:hypothetical protein HaLaN_27388 [Haematococcus lacustris]